MAGAAGMVPCLWGRRSGFRFRVSACRPWSIRFMLAAATLLVNSPVPGRYHPADQPPQRSPPPDLAGFPTAILLFIQNNIPKASLLSNKPVLPSLGKQGGEGKLTFGIRGCCSVPYTPPLGTGLYQGPRGLETSARVPPKPEAALRGPARGRCRSSRSAPPRD